MSDPGPLSAPARALVRQHIDSLGRLDLLLLLHGDPSSRWTAARMAKQVRTSAKWTQTQMEEMERAGLLSCADTGEDSAWSYDPADEAIAEAVQDLVGACRMDWPGVTREVMTLRGSGAQAFSDAFRLRRDDG